VVYRHGRDAECRSDFNAAAFCGMFLREGLGDTLFRQSSAMRRQTDFATWFRIVWMERLE
jgi:hypothetical protein